MADLTHLQFWWFLLGNTLQQLNSYEAEKKLCSIKCISDKIINSIDEKDSGQNPMSRKNIFLLVIKIFVIADQEFRTSKEQVNILVLLQYYSCSWKQSSRFSVNASFLFQFLSLCWRRWQFLSLKTANCDSSAIPPSLCQGKGEQNRNWTVWCSELQGTQHT